MQNRTSYDKVIKEVTAGGRLYINNKYISTRSNLYKDKNENLYLSEWISDYEYSSKFSALNILTQSDAKMIESLIMEITKNSELFTYKNVTPGADAEDNIINNLKRQKLFLMSYY